MNVDTRAKLQELVKDLERIYQYGPVNGFAPAMLWQTLLELRAVLAACLAAEGEEPLGWQPIETAPKDGTQILIWIVGIEPRPRIAYWADRGMEYGWFGLQSQHLLGVPVTHWMPLPEPPR